MLSEQWLEQGFLGGAAGSSASGCTCVGKHLLNESQCASGAEVQAASRLGSR